MIDPAISVEDAQQMLEALSAMRGPDPSMLPTIRRAAEFAEEGSELWLLANLRLGGHLTQPAQAMQALSCLGAVLRHVAGRGDPVERAAAVNYSSRALSAGREIEGLAAARRALTLMREADDAPGTAIALHMIVSVLSEMDAWAEFDEAILQFEQAAAALPSPMRERVLRDVASSRADAAHSRGNHAEALGIVAEIEAGDHPPPPAWLLTFKAWLNAHLGNLPEARRLVDEARELGIDGWMRFATEWADLICLAAAGKTNSASARASEIMDWLEESARAEVGTGKRWSFSLKLAETLTDVPELAGLSHRAHDLAVGAALERIREVDRFFRDYPGYLHLSPEDAGLIRGYRERLIENQKSLCAEVARTLSRTTAEDDLPRFDACGREGMYVICAWCTRIRMEGGTWLPVGQFVSETEDIAVTHSICPDCKAEARRSIPVS